MENRYHHHNRRKYSLKVHIVLVTKYRKQILKGHISDDVKQKIYDIANVYGYEILAMETDKDHIHFLLGCDTTDRVSDIVECYWQKRIFWSDGYFACSIGEVSTATIRRYIDSRG